MDRYTVLGGDGFIGRKLALTLRAAGHSVATPPRDSVSGLSGALGRVIYCIGLTADFARRPFDTVEAHVAVLARLLSTTSFERVVYLSSTRLYDTLGASGGAEDTPLRLDPAEPRHLYDLSKALGENLCLTASGGRGAVARLANVYDWRPGAPGFLSAWLRQAAASRRFTVDCDSGSVRDYIHLDDAVAGIAAIAADDRAGIVNVASGENASNADLAGSFNRLGWQVSLLRTTARQSAPACAIDRLRALGVAPRPVGAVIAGWASGQPDPQCAPDEKRGGPGGGADR